MEIHLLRNSWFNILKNLADFSVINLLKIYLIIHNVISLCCCSCCCCFFFTENFSMLYCCIDCKNVVRDKKFLQRRLFCLLFSPLQVTSWKVSNLVVRNIRNIIHCFRVVFSFFELVKFFPEMQDKYQARKFHF